MLNSVLAFSLRNRLLVLAAALAVAAAGAWQATRLPVDVFPDLDRPTVAVLTDLAESPGLPPEDVETLVTRPLEQALNGSPGVRRVRSSSTTGLSVVWAEFDWSGDVYRARQVVAEKVQLVRPRLPRDANPVLAPIASIMGEVMLLGLRTTSPVSGPEDRREQAMTLRTEAEFALRNRLLAVEGVAQVTVLGGVLRQFQVATSPERLAAAGVTLEQLADAAGNASALAGGAVFGHSARESLLRFDGLAHSRGEIADTPVVWRGRRAVLVRDVADVLYGGPVRRGDAGVWVRGDPVDSSPPDTAAPTAVILAVQKQPHANSLTLDRRLDRVLDEAESGLPAGMKLERHVFRQADFIRRAVDNVTEAIRDGVLWVFLLLLLFLGNLRACLVTLTALPLSVLCTALVFGLFGLSVNTMTLGGVAVAVGELVDDAVVDVENIFRRLRSKVVSGQWSVVSRNDAASASPTTNHSPLTTVYEASSEIRNSVVYATLVVCLVVLPLFGLSGLEGRLFAPLGLAYVVALLASLVVSLTVTPALASLLLPGSRAVLRPREPPLLRGLKWLDARLVRFSLRHHRGVLGAVVVLAGLSLTALAGMGGEFLPPFEEGTLTVNVQAEPGTSLSRSAELGRRVEALLAEIPEVVSVARRTGRAEGDEHAEGTDSSEFDVRLAEPELPRPGAWAAVLRAVPGLRGWGVEASGRPRAAVRAEVERRLQDLAGLKVNVGQPISHRLDHVLSGVRAQVVLKVFGPDLRVLRERAEDVRRALADVPGVVDLRVEPQAEVPQLRLEFDRTKARAYGLRPGDLARWVEAAYGGRVVGRVLDQERSFDVVVWFDDATRGDRRGVANVFLDTPSGRRVALGEVVKVNETTGPNQLNREGVERRVVVSCNVRGRDLSGTVSEVRRHLAPVEDDLHGLGGGYRLELGGQHAARQEADARLLALGALALAGVFLLLHKALGSWLSAFQVLVNVPLAAFGSVVALLVANHPAWSDLAAAPWWRWPAVWLGSTTLSLAHWVGFITLTGIVSRNGILLLSHYEHLMNHEGEAFGEAMVVRGTLERLAPVLLTAGVAGAGLVPLALGAGQPGKEILHPLAVVVLGGLVASTLLDQLVTPALFYAFGRKRQAGRATELTAPDAP